MDKLVELFGRGHNGGITGNLIDVGAVIMSVLWISNFEDGLGIYILGVTALTITIRAVVMLRNLFTKNKAKKL